ncbi:universal stress protein [Yinghuangia soli]|uniref:Universal stress protein n=1 Tax=Yinghuangia soli TaxID=2908204 RepID=A0AA41U9F7_9ACTN|nr:universal stress protein [Yinghuangia soli]MCF2533819.1 universal stress protein [Yinghuangia soli]
MAGVDGSDTDPPVLAWAAREALLRGAELVVVHAWQPAQADRAPYAPPCARGHHEFQEAEAHHLLKRAVESALSLMPDVAVRAVAAQGPAVPTLLEHAAGADLLVLGRRCRDQAAEPALGPVTRACVRRAACPVVTVAAPRLPSAADGPRALPQPTGNAV